MLRRFLICLLLLASAAQAQEAEQDLPVVVGSTGDVSLSVNGGFWPIGAGARYFVADGTSIAVAVVRATFEEGDPTTRFDPFVQSNARAFTASAAVEWEASVADWLVVSRGMQAYYRRQTDDVVVGYEARFVPVVDEGGRRTDGAGVAVTGGLEARIWGPLRLGFGAGFVGVGVQRVRGGTVEEDGQLVLVPPGEARTRLRFGSGSSQFYVAVRL